MNLENSSASDCRYFSGYKPCHKKKLCAGCPDYSARGVRILLINLDAMGDVVRTTALLPALKRKHPESFITWLTLKNAAPILENNPLVDEVLIHGLDAVLELEFRKFEVVLNVDKSKRSSAIALRVDAETRKGFGIDANGAIVPLTPEAEYQYLTGLDDDLKFFKNQKNEQEMLAETMGVEFRRDRYILNLSAEEKTFVESRKKALCLDSAEVVVGFNTGCSPLYPYKKLPVKFQAELADAISQIPGVRVILLGGPEDVERNSEISRLCQQPVIETPCDEGLRRGIQYMALADVVVSGDSLGMHLAIGLKKRAAVWFGLTCEQEIDLFDRGVKVLSKIDCRPCWRKSCDKPVKCFETVDRDELLSAIGEMINSTRKEKGI